MKKIVINGGRPLKGEVTISGAKNSVVALIICLNKKHPEDIRKKYNFYKLYSKVEHIFKILFLWQLIRTLWSSNGWTTWRV